MPLATEILKESQLKLSSTKRNKYTIYSKVNSKGVRYEVTRFIEADNEDLAISIYKEHLKQEFSGIRNITCIKAKEFEEDDVEFSKEIELPKAVESKEDNIPEFNINGKSIKMPKELNNIEFGYIIFYLLNLKLHNLKMYTCYYTHKKKINNSYKKNNLLIYTSFNTIDAINDIKRETTSQGIPFKEKYIHELKETTIEDAVSNEIIRKRILNRGKEKYGDLNKAYETIKKEVLNSPKSTEILKEVKK